MSEDFRSQCAGVIGRRIRSSREIRGLTLEDLAMWSGLDQGEIEQYENGIGRITVDDLEKVANALCLPISHFLDSCVLCGNDLLLS
ncbi:MAG: helix-turn-helix transcriptional regulator [Planctomycetota bacterium]